MHGISTYPLMLLPYTPMAQRTNDRWLQDPEVEGEQYLAIVSFLRDHGYKLRTLWSFTTRPGEYEGPYEHSNFVGIGPRAWGLVNNKFTLNHPNVFEYLDRLEDGVLPLYACSEVKDHAVSRFARSLYRGEISRNEMDAMVAEDRKVNRYLLLLRTLGLMRRRGDRFVLTDRALTYGSSATKRIAMATLIKMNDVLREVSPGVGTVGDEQPAPGTIGLDGMLPSTSPPRSLVQLRQDDMG